MAVAFDPKKYTTYEWLTIGGAVAGFVFLFLKAEKLHDLSFSYGVSGWHYLGFWFPWILVLAAAALLVVREMSPNTLSAMSSIPASLRVIVAGATVIAAFITLIRVFTLPSGSGTGYHYGPGFGAYLELLAMIVAAVGAVMALLGSGEAIPGMSGRNSSAAVGPNDPAV